MAVSPRALLKSQLSPPRQAPVPNPMLLVFDRSDWLAENRITAIQARRSAQTDRARGPRAGETCWER